jgi:hypothetical protein
MALLCWRYECEPRVSRIARIPGGRYEIDLAACAYAFIADDEAGAPVYWHRARTLYDAQRQCAKWYREADSSVSGRTVAIIPGRQASGMRA